MDVIFVETLRVILLPMDTISGSVEHITYYNTDNGYTVLRLRPEVRSRQRLPDLSFDGLITVVGNLPELSPGETLNLQGSWEKHPKHGKQFKAEVCNQLLPSTIAGIEGYLGSGLIKGIGPKMAERIVAQFGINTLDVIEQQPQRLQEVPGIGTDRAGKICIAWVEQKQVKEIMLFLHEHGVSTNLAVKIHKVSGEPALQTVLENPYQLERDIYGVDFKAADCIAQALGLAIDHPSRIEACLVYVLNQMAGNGHVFAPRELLTGETAAFLGVPPALILPSLNRLQQTDLIRAARVPVDNRSRRSVEKQPVDQTDVVYLTAFYFGETGVAERIVALANSKILSLKEDQLVFTGGDLSDEQKTAVKMALTHPVSILTGEPGTGKTTCLKALITILNAQGICYALASPIGRAAKRLAEATGQQASTIHRQLEFSPKEGFTRNVENPLKAQFLVVDEASMLDLLLTHHLLKAVRKGTHILFVGDIDQLSSVGPGNVLRDLIASGIVPVTRLTTIFRQAAGVGDYYQCSPHQSGADASFPKREWRFLFLPG